MSQPPSQRPNLGWLLVTIAVIGIDQYTKRLVTNRFELFDRLPVMPYFDLVRLHNTGAAFSFLANASGWQNWFFTGVAVTVSAAILWWLFRQPADRVVVPLGLVLVLGGAVGNLIDRLQHGYVVDFFLFYYGRWSFPAFNVADAAITLGVGLLLIDGFFLEGRRLRQTGTDDGASASSGQ
jgi:signal peptidase II